jgi:hypothetical protein
MRRKINWPEVITRWESSGLSQAEFCRRERLPEKSFYYHKRRQVKETGESHFVELSGSAQSNELELRIGEDIRIRLPGDIAPERLASVVKCLR